MPKRDLTGCRAMVTGASGGIGLEIVRSLAKFPVRFVLLARREEALSAVAAELRAADRDVELVVGDVTDPAIRAAAVERAKTRWGGLDLLVNNAGVGGIGPFQKSSEARLRNILEVNFFAAVELIRSALPLLKRGRDPLIVNVSSVLGHRGIPFYTEYCASKFALQGFSEALRAELAADNVGLLVVSPGTTKTEFFDHVLGNKGKVPWAEGGGVSPAYVAAATVRAIRNRRNEIIPSFKGKLLVGLNQVLPWVANWAMARYGRQAVGEPANPPVDPDPAE
ncbi:MAG TPA: SDR family NAD(P)-dependent oxidoreductase [Pirellulales bacterium]|jgi:short-subunit dehydrogenase|nr:SDR family NAD(P)-dependent oxidoreductase [Pirellulales bacterium]